MDQGHLVSSVVAAQTLGVSQQTIYNWQDIGVLGLVEVGARRMIPLVDVENLRSRREKFQPLLQRIIEAEVANPSQFEPEYSGSPEAVDFKFSFEK